MRYKCPYCGKTLKKTSFEDYKCPAPGCVGEFFKVRNGKLITREELFKHSEENDLDVCPEDWRDYEDGFYVSWLPPTKRNRNT